MKPSWQVETNMLDKEGMRVEKSSINMSAKQVFENMASTHKANSFWSHQKVNENKRMDTEPLGYQ